MNILTLAEQLSKNVVGLASTNPSGLANEWKNEIFSWIKPFIFDFLIPIAIAVIAVFILIQIASAAAAKKHNNNEEFKGHLIAIATSVLCIALLASASSWLPLLGFTVG